MGDGMKRATLEALRTRSWSYKSFDTTTRRNVRRALTGDAVILYYEAIADGDREAFLMLGGTGFSDRRVDRANQILKGVGLIAFDKAARVWKAL